MSINGPFRNRLRPALTLSLLFMVFPNQVFPQTAQPNLKIDAKCAVLMDSISGRVLFEQNSQLKIAPASFVKLLTLYIAFDTIRDDT